MSDDINFQGDDFPQNQLNKKAADNTPKMAKMLIGWGVAKNAEQAQMYLLGAIVVIVALAIFVFLSALGGGAAPAEIDPATIPGGGAGEPGIAPGNF